MLFQNGVKVNRSWSCFTPLCICFFFNYFFLKIFQCRFYFQFFCGTIFVHKVFDFDGFFLITLKNWALGCDQIFNFLLLLLFEISLQIFQCIVNLVFYHKVNFYCVSTGIILFNSEEELFPLDLR